MKKVTMICVTAIVCFSISGMVQAVHPAMPPNVSAEPFVGISFTPDSLDLGTVSPVGFKNLPAKLQARIVANCSHQVEASFEPFKSKNHNATISPKHTTVEVNGVEIPVAGSGVAIFRSAKPTPPGGVEVPVDIKFSARSLILYPAGQYKGSLVFTIMAKQ
jgi:hypothetical protein